MSFPRFPISFDDGQVALGVRAGPGVDLARAIRGMGLTTGVPTIVPVSAGSRPAQLARLGPLVEKVVVAVAEAVEATVVDEGASGGITTVLGEARRRKKAGFPFVGVAAGADPGELDPSTLDAEHTHFVLVPAGHGPAMAGWIASVATAMAGGHGSVALVAAGGEPAWDCVAAHLRDGRPVVAVARSGGVADQLAAALAGRPADSRARSLAASGRIYAVDPGRGAAHVAEVLRRALRPEAGKRRPGEPAALGPGPGAARVAGH